MSKSVRGCPVVSPWRRRAPLALALAALIPSVAPAAVFINEFHYDDATSAGDVGERIEVVATAGETLSNYRIYLYNGSSPSAATTYDNDLVPAGSVVSCGGSVRIATLSYPTNGLQNGSNDGFALVDGSGNVVQFLSYEGSITASNGPAAGKTSSNLPVSESGSTAAGTSLQLSGSGSAYSQFAWQSSANQTFGACNNGQSFTGSNPNTPPSVTSTTPANGASNFPAAGDLVANFSEAVSLAAGALTLQCATSGAVALTYPSSGTAISASTGTALYAGEACTFTVVASKVTDAGGASPAANTVVNFNVASGGGTSGYYAHVNTSSASQLRCSLHATIKGHTVYPYSGGTSNTWSILEIADEDPNNAGRILDAYRNRSYLKVTDRAGSGSGLKYNREHTWPNSLGFGSTTGNLGLPNAPYTDTHMLYLTDAGYNADRGNKPYANCSLSSGCGERVTEISNGSGGGSGVYPGNSNWFKTPDGNAGSFEVWGQRKGDMARAILYMAIRYEGGTDPNSGQSEPDLELTDDRSKIVITSSSPAYMGLLTTLLQWHQADPPTAAEKARNEVIYSFQGNRNPFIDHPEWATASLFTSTKPASCQLIP
ncbi:endonuclease [Lysobacter sp. BMK333-48F3]|uniref:endonuclease n=1 Tax=Lysobacter sp. BMK333-48F3 TaxID=2867962 RepID=UPI001C8B766C|nr:endonuclease [Lysobacter sp. BMK333-48F3]MBX9401717.1 endonuclease [Lysobacter sp. BMK333-48F3]